MSILSRFVKDESGATAIEYSLIGALMAAATIAGVASFSGELFKSLGAIGQKMISATK